MRAFSVAIAVVALTAVVTFASAGPRRRAKASVFEGFGDFALIPTVTQESFRTMVMEPTLPVILNFYAADCPNCAAAAAELKNASIALQGFAHVAAFDGAKDEQSKGLAEMFGVTSFPALLYFNPEMMPVQGQPEGSFMKYPVGYSGPVTTEAIVRWALETSSSRHLSFVEDAEDLEVFQKRYSQFEVPKILLLTQSNFTTPVFRAVSHKFRYGAVFGVSRNAPFIASLGVNVDDLPVVAVWTSPTEAPELIAAQSLTLATLSSALEKYALPEEKRKMLQSQFIALENEEMRKEAEDAKRVRAHPPVVLKTRDEFTTLCRKRPKGFCVLCFVEDVNAPGLLEWLETAATKMSQRGKQESQLIVIDGPKNHALANHFGAAENGFPSVVYFNPQKRVYYTHIGAFNERAIVSFWADRLPKARAKPVPKKIPRFVEEEDTKQPSESASGDDIGVGDEL